MLTIDSEIILKKEKRRTIQTMLYPTQLGTVEYRAAYSHAFMQHAIVRCYRPSSDEPCSKGGGRGEEEVAYPLGGHIPLCGWPLQTITVCLTVLVVGCVVLGLGHVEP